MPCCGASTLYSPHPPGSPWAALCCGDAQCRASCRSHTTRSRAGWSRRPCASLQPTNAPGASSPRLCLLCGRSHPRGREGSLSEAWGCTLLVNGSVFSVLMGGVCMFFKETPIQELRPLLTRGLRGQSASCVAGARFLAAGAVLASPLCGCVAEGARWACSSVTLPSVPHSAAASPRLQTWPVHLTGGHSQL